MNTQIVSKGVAVHTRDIARGQDYGWYVRKGDLWLSNRTEDIYRAVLRDTSGDTRKFALLVAEKRAGLLLCDIASERIDHGNRIIYDTLYTEFTSMEKAELLEYAACLLIWSDEDYKNIEEKVLNSAEQFYKNRENPQMKYDQHPFSHCKSMVEPEKFSGKRALPYKDSMNFPDHPNVRKCAAHLKWLAKEHKNFSRNSFLFVSTGRVGMERCKQIADKYDTCLILTMTSEIETETNLQKHPLISILKKNTI